MSYDIVKDLKLDKPNNRISAKIANSSFTDNEGNYIFENKYDIYPYLNTWEEKYARLVGNVITGGVHIWGNHKLRKIEFGNEMIELENYYNELCNSDDVTVYNKYKDIINNILKEKKEYIIKFKDSMAYLKNIGMKTYRYTFNINEAKKYSKREITKISGLKEYEVVNFKKELYESKEQSYKLYLNVISEQKSNIRNNDLLYFLQEYEFAADGSGKYSAYVSLKEDYPNDKLIDEIVRLGEIIKNKKIVECHEDLVKMSKDKDFLKRNNTFVQITGQDIEEYNKAKAFLEISKEKYKFDYDVDKQYKLLDEKFKNLYINKEIYKEYCELFFDEDLEEEQ